MTISWTLVGFILLAASANIFGSLIFLIKKEWSKRGTNILMALSAGILVSIAVIHLIPEAMHHNQNSSAFILVGMGTMYFFQKMVGCNTQEINQQNMAKSSTSGTFWGMMLHTFFDGLIVVLSFGANFHLGIAVLIGIIIHKVTDGLIVSSIIFNFYHDRKKAIGSSVVLGISTLAGALIAVFLSGFALPYEEMSIIAIAFSAGIFLYVVGADLFPIINSTNDRFIVQFFFWGIVLYYVLFNGLELFAPSMHIH